MTSLRLNIGLSTSTRSIAGRNLKDAVQTTIQRGEERWIGVLPPSDRAVFLRALERLADQSDRALRELAAQRPGILC
jgi:hypothetical protein